MKILLTNDDGINADGLFALYEALSKIGNVTVVAPASEQSAVGHAITIADPLRVKEVKRDGTFFGYAVNGTPADCVKLAVSTLMDKKPDIVVSGINLGPNTGINVLYSGTLSGATEGAIFGIPSFGISLATFVDPDYSYAANFAADLANKIRNMNVPKGTLFNINVPAIGKEKIKGLRYTFQSKIAIADRFDKRKDPADRTYYWLTGDFSDIDGEEGSDANAIHDGYVSVTPIHIDMTDWEYLGKMKKESCHGKYAYE